MIGALIASFVVGAGVVALLVLRKVRRFDFDFDGNPRIPWAERRAARREMRAALKQLDIRNGWIIERGRDRHILVLHCARCGNQVRGIDGSGGHPAADRMITNLTAAMRCRHRSEEEL